MEKQPKPYKFAEKKMNLYELQAMLVTIGNNEFDEMDELEFSEAIKNRIEEGALPEVSLCYALSYRAGEILCYGYGRSVEEAVQNIEKDTIEIGETHPDFWEGEDL